MSYIVTRWWTFADPLPAFVRQVRLLQELAGDADARLRVLTFDGRRNASTTPADAADIVQQLPPRLCAADVRSVTLRAGGPKHRDLASTLNISTTSAKWAKVTRSKPANPRDHGSAMTFRSQENHAKFHRIRRMPHLIQGWARPPRGTSRPAQVEQVLEPLPKLFTDAHGGDGSGAVAGLAGGVDFVGDFTEMGLYDVMSVIAENPAAAAELRQRFDDLHKIMFGPPAMFDLLSAA